jgi:hypothetical protein
MTDANKDEDSWEKMTYLIKTNNTACRLENKIEEINKCKSKEEQLLKKLEKGRAIEDRPTSLATALPYRGSHGWNLKKAQLCGKIETMQRAIRSGDMTEKERKECRTLKLQMRKRGVEKSETTSKSHTAKKRRLALGDINQQQPRNRRDQ